MIFSLMNYDEERDEFFLQGIDDVPQLKKEEKNNKKKKIKKWRKCKKKN